MKIKILNVQFHRNGSGVCEGFFAVLFQDKQTPKEWNKGICGDQFIASFRCEDNDRIIWESFRVVNIKNFNLSFRGDHFIIPITDEVEKYCIAKGLREKSFSAAAFPNMYQPLTSIPS